MILKEQIISLIFSSLYGIIINIIFRKIEKFLYDNKRISIFNNLLFFCDITLIYFAVMYKINGGIIHIYFLFITILSFVLTNKNLQKKCQKISN